MRLSTIIVSSVLVAVLIMFTILIGNYYFSTVKSGLFSKAKTASLFFANYITNTYSEYYESAYKYAETFEDSDKLELQFIDTDGRSILSTNNISSGILVDTTDVTTALNKGEIATYVGNSASGEFIISAAAPIFYADDQIAGVIRFVSSADLVKQQTFNAFIIAFVIAFSVMIIILVINIVFMRSFIEPVGEITSMATRIANGSYGIQIEKSYSDEIGIMVESINEMSLKIAQAEKTQSEFVSSISHELRTPLTAISGWSETLLYNDDLDNETVRGITIILKEARRLTKMVEELLEFTRIEDGRFTLNVEQIDFVAELEDSIFTYQELLKQEQIEIVYEPCDDILPPIPADPARLRQVFLNIFDNARKYGGDGKRIDVSVTSTADSVITTVRDYGKGLPESELANIKVKFYKGSNAKARGSGIGLAVCDEIIKFHGGTLTFKNAEGGGLMAVVELPLKSSI